MNFFKKLFTKKQKLILEEKTEKLTKNIANSKEDFINLAKELIENNYPEIIEQYSTKLNQLNSNPELIFDDNEYYYDTVNNQFEACRGNSTEIKENIEWFLLIDTLQFNNILWELDWKTDREETNDALKLLAKKKNYPINNLNDIVVNEKEQDLSEYLTIVNQNIEIDNIVSINLYINSDSYVTGIIKNENINKVIDLALKCNQKISKY